MDEEDKINLTADELKKEIIDYLDQTSTKAGGERTKPGCNLKHGKQCALGTCVDNFPRVTAVDHFNEGMTIWVAAEPGGKIANIKKNPNVSLVIYTTVDHSIEQKHLQVWGKAELINLNNSPKEFRRKVSLFGIDEATSGIIEELIQIGIFPKEQEQAAIENVLSHMNFIKIIPEKVIVLHMRPGKLALKKIWENGKVTVKVPSV